MNVGQDAGIQCLVVERQIFMANIRNNYLKILEVVLR